MYELLFICLCDFMRLDMLSFYTRVRQKYFIWQTFCFVCIFVITVLSKAGVPLVADMVEINESTMCLDDVCV